MRIFQNIIIAALSSMALGQDTCLVGDIVYLDGDSIGFLGSACLDESMFNATESTCVNGAIVDTQTVMTCDKSVPYCVQCGPDFSAGAALCLETPASPDFCKSLVIKPDPISQTSGGGGGTPVITATTVGGRMMGGAGGGMGGMGRGGMGMAKRKLQRVGIDSGAPYDTTKRFRGSVM